MTHRFKPDDTGLPDRARVFEPDRPHLVEEELAQRWRLSTRTLQRWRRDGSGPAYLRLGRRIAYRISDVEQFEKGRLNVGAVDMTAQLTIITSERPDRLSKFVRRGSDGTLLREPGGLLVEGHARVAAVSSLDDLSDLLQRLGPAQALTFGLPRGGDGRIVSRAAQARKG